MDACSGDDGGVSAREVDEGEGAQEERSKHANYGREEQRSVRHAGYQSACSLMREKGDDGKKSYGGGVWDDVSRTGEMARRGSQTGDISRSFEVTRGVEVTHGVSEDDSREMCQT
eukprot:TRINITY_DN8310_c0_g1_i1.p1 TRINITY_DN8310_c0_g1~~TRINITY_DN8310_c0_g1_i1.p1  ORF type:complete len:115 (+),score=19.77 TRINITY_DN8310_c0_g1_i1:254-598(+)